MFLIFVLLACTRTRICLVGPAIENIKLSLLFVASFNKVSKEIFQLHVAEVQTDPRMNDPRMNGPIG